MTTREDSNACTIQDTIKIQKFLERYPLYARIVTEISNKIQEVSELKTSQPGLNFNHNNPNFKSFDVSNGLNVIKANTELEIRLGTIWTGNGDHSIHTKEQKKNGIPEELFLHISEFLENCDDWSCIIPNQETHDYYFHVSNNYNGTKKNSTQKFIPNVPIDKNIEIRSEVSFLLQTKQIKIDHTHKQKKMVHDFSLAHCGPAKLNFDLFARVQLSKEYHIDKKKLTKSVNPNHVRIKQRTSFIKYQGDSNQSPGWKFDLTKTWSGRTRAEAEENQRLKNIVYEFECEILNFDKVDPNMIPHTILSLLLKVGALIPFDFRFENFGSSVSDTSKQ